MSEVYTVVRAAASLPQSTSEPLFTVVGGPVQVVLVIGEVAEDLEGISNSSTVAFGTGGSPVSIWSGSLNGGLEGALIGVNTGTTGVQSLNAVLPFGRDYVVQEDAQVFLTCASSITGEVSWLLRYRPLVPGAYVEAV